MDGSTASTPTTREVFRFADFEVRPRERVLLKGGELLRIGSRAFDLLLALLSHGEGFVSPENLRRSVWHDRVVEDNNLRVHLTSLRKVLGARAIVRHARHGYRLAHHVHAEASGEAAVLRGNLPPRRAAVFGRERIADALVGTLSARARVTIVGAAGIGKTTLATVVAHRAAARHADGAWLVELAPLTQGAMVCHAVADALGLKLPVITAHGRETERSVESLVEAV